MDHADRGARELRPRVELGDRRVVPGLDLASEHGGDRRTVELQAAAHPGQVVGHRDRAQCHRELEHGPFHLRLVSGLEGRVTPGEVDRARSQLGDAGTRSDRVVVERHALVFERSRPLLVDRRRERRPGTVDGPGAPAARPGGAARGGATGATSGQSDRGHHRGGN